MQFRYIGDKDKTIISRNYDPTQVKEKDRYSESTQECDMSPPKRTTVFGVEFELNGDPQEVPKQFERKFMGNKCFELVEKEESAETPKPRGRPKKQ